VARTKTRPRTVDPARTTQTNTPRTTNSRKPRTNRPVRRRGLDWRWIAVGVAALAVIGLIAVNVFSNQSGGGASATVGQVTGPTIDANQKAANLLAVGTPAPNLTWSINGQDGSLAGLQGKPVLLEYFASWCPHCQKEAAVLRAIQNKYGDRINVIAVNASPFGMDQRSPASPADIERFQRTHNAPYQHLFDQQLVGGRLYGVNSFPTIYLIDKNGVIQYAAEGEVTEGTLSSQIDKALAS
jgi:thiol-disulfide isomerase/thioredoxin